jgi:hypothetical protein
MNTLDRDEAIIDQITERASVQLSEGMTRGHFLAKLGKALLVVVGTGIVANLPLLPEDRRVASADHCSAWYNCGIGTPAMCAHCGGGGSDTSCPGDCTQGSSWTACCAASPQCSYYVSYVDCCKDAFMQNCFTGCSSRCHDSVQNWCGSAGDFVCTLSIIGGVCSGINCPTGPAQ